MSGASPVLIETARLSRSFGAETVLAGVSLVLRGGETLTVLGPSGSGKTTLLTMLGLLLEPTSGRILVGGRDAASLSDGERSRLRNTHFGFVPQTARLIGSLSVLDNVLLPAFLAGRARQKRAAARELLERLGLEARAGFLPHQLSQGQKRRVVLARAVLLQPSVVLADEPTNDLDAKRAAQVAEFLLGLPAAGCALVLATHDPQLARRAGNCRQIQQGGLVQLASAEERPPGVENPATAQPAS